MLMLQFFRLTGDVYSQLIDLIEYGFAIDLRFGDADALISDWSEPYMVVWSAWLWWVYLAWTETTRSGRGWTLEPWLLLEPRHSSVECPASPCPSLSSWYVWHVCVSPTLTTLSAFRSSHIADVTTVLTDMWFTLDFSEKLDVLKISIHIFTRPPHHPVNTLCLCSLQMELTNDIQFLLPIMVAIMVAKWVGDFFTHPLYHALLELKCIPFLSSEPVVYNESKKR